MIGRSSGEVRIDLADLLEVGGFGSIGITDFSFVFCFAGAPKGEDNLRSKDFSNLGAGLGVAVLNTDIGLFLASLGDVKGFGLSRELPGFIISNGTGDSLVGGTSSAGD